MGYVLMGRIRNHTYRKDLGRGYTQNELTNAKAAMRRNHIKKWGRTKSKFSFEVRYN